LQDRGEKIDKFHQRLGGLPRLNTGRTTNEQRTTHRLFVTAVFLEPAMLPQQIAVIAKKNNKRVLRLSGFFQGVQHPPDIPVEKFDRGIICSDDALLFLIRERAKGFRNLPIILWPRPRNREFLRSMSAAVFHWE